MYCDQCGAQLPEGARFCGSCGAPVHGTPSADAGATVHAGSAGDVPNAATPSASVMATPDAPDAAAAPSGAHLPQPKQKKSLTEFMMQTRQIGRLTVPTFAAIIFALVAFAGAAYAAFMAYEHLIKPALEQTQQQHEEVVEEQTPTDGEQPEESEPQSESETPAEVQPEEEPANPDAEAAMNAYQGILEQYREAIANHGAPPGGSEDYPTVFGTNSTYFQYLSMGTLDGFNWSYAYRDLNDDGIPELLIGSGSNIDNAITWVNGEASSLFSAGLSGGGGFSSSYTLRSGNVISASTGAHAYQMFRVFKYLQGPGQDNLDNFDDFQMIASCSWDGVGDSPNTITILDFDGTTKQVDGSTEEARSSQLESFMNALDAAYPPDTSIEWQSL